MIRLSEDEALVRLEQMVQAGEEPCLSPAQLDELLVMARRIDADDIRPSEDGWTPSWDLNAAAAEGWRWKAGKVAGRYNVSVDGASLQRAQAIAHCLTMAERYANKVVGTLSLARYPDESNAIANL